MAAAGRLPWERAPDLGLRAAIRALPREGSSESLIVKKLLHDCAGQSVFRALPTCGVGTGPLAAPKS